MKEYAKSYAMFIAFSAVTALLVRPMVKQLNNQMLNDIVGA
ncbi:hypothetical protein [Herbaspirillum huttiense]